MRQLMISLALGILLLPVGVTSVGAALLSRLDGEAVYDADRNITWLANANLARTNKFGVSGIYSAGYMSWATAQNWIAAMNAANHLGFSDWRLPTSLQPLDTNCTWTISGKSYGPNCTGSELGHLFYEELGGIENNSITSVHNENFSLFQDVRTVYWTGTESAGNPDVYVWTFDTYNGYQNSLFKSSFYYVWAVRTGDVAAVPVPAAAGLFAAGLLGLAGAGRRRCAS